MFTAISFKTWEERFWGDKYFNNSERIKIVGSWNRGGCAQLLSEMTLNIYQNKIKKNTRVPQFHLYKTPQSCTAPTFK